MNPKIGFASVAALLAGAIASSSVYFRNRRNPRDKERKRREFVTRHGRIIEGYVTTCEGCVVHYSYQWRKVRYEASQDLADVPNVLGQFENFLGPATIKFLSSRPSNSIVISETWCGLPKAVRLTRAGE